MKEILLKNGSICPENGKVFESGLLIRDAEAAAWKVPGNPEDAAV